VKARSEDDGSRLIGRTVWAVTLLDDDGFPCIYGIYHSEAAAKAAQERITRGNYAEPYYIL
jgi:hypothetical protein